MQVIVLGRTQQELQQFSTSQAGYIGRYIVGEGEDMHLTSKVLLDFKKPHVILIAGKRGTGKSYAAGVILEEFLELPEQQRNKLCLIVVDPMGIYWSIKFENKKQKSLLKKWKLEPKAYSNVFIFVPHGLKEKYKQAGIPYDATLTLATNQFEASDWILSLGLKKESEEAISLAKVYSKLPKNFDITDLIEAIRDEPTISQKSKNYLINIFETIKSYGIFSKQGSRIEEIVKPGHVVIIDVSQMRGEELGLKNLIVAWLAKKVYQKRLIAKKIEESAKLKGKQTASSFPLVWFVFEEAHNFIPADAATASTQPILTLAKQGREPGIGLITITQMPNKIHADVLRQTDLVFCFRITSKQDIDALHIISQTYMREEIELWLSKLPKEPGAAIVLDDNLEKILRLQVRPRKSWHAGGTAIF